MRGCQVSFQIFFRETLLKDSKESTPIGFCPENIAFREKVNKIEQSSGKLLLMQVGPESATTLWVDGPMAKVYAYYLGTSAGRTMSHHLFMSETKVRFSLTDFELSCVKVSFCNDLKQEHQNEYLRPTRRAKNLYVDYVGQEGVEDGINLKQK